jgi:putative ABC transport system permease protein
MMSPTTGLLLQETTLATRRLWKAPRFVAVAVLTVAAATAPSLIFNLVGRAVLPPLPFARSNDLMHVWQRLDGSWRGSGSYPRLRYLREHSRTMDVAAQTGGAFFLDRGGSTIRLTMMAITPNYFDVLGVRPLLGRTFREEDNGRPFAHPVVILSEPLWRNQFGASVDVVGETVVLSGETFSVVGVMPAIEEGYSGYRRTADGWVPAMMSPRGMLSKPWRETARAIESPQTQIWLGLARLRAGHDLREARAEAALLGREVKALWPDDEVDAPFDLVRMSEDAINPKILHAVAVLKAAGVLVLVLGGLNLGSLFLTRGIERSRALSVHALLGAPRMALLWGPLWEGLSVGVLGALGALALTRGALMLLGLIEPTILTAPFGFTFDPGGWRIEWPLASLSFALSVLTALGCSLRPALRATRGDLSRLSRGGPGIIGGGLRQLRLTRPGGLLIASEIALALALTLPAVLLARSLARLVTADVGFRPQSVVTAELNLPTDLYPEMAVPGFVDQVTRGLKETEGVEGASWASCLPIDCGFYDTAVRRAGSREKGFGASVHVVAPDAFRTLGIPLRSGRDFTRDDRAAGPRVAILSEQAARLLGAGVLGTRLEAGGDTIEVVGLVADIPYRDLASEPMPAIYFPLNQKPLTQGVLLVRSTRPLADMADRLRQTMTSLDPRLERLAVTSLQLRVGRDLARFRGAAWLLGAAALLALFLSGVGTYGLLSSFVAQGLPEIGSRMALGATRARIGSSITAAALRLAMVGLLAGSCLGGWGATYLRPYLFGVSPWDTQTHLLTLLVSIALALVTALRPAERASRLDPMVVLRSE